MRAARLLVLLMTGGIAFAGWLVGEVVASQRLGDATAGGYPKLEPRLGVLLEDASEEGGFGRPGAILRGVTPGGAQDAGLRIGDVVVECDGERVQDSAGVISLLKGAPHGSPIRLGVMRQARRLDLTVFLDSREIRRFLASHATGPTREGPYLRTLPRGGAERLGVTILDLSPQLAEYFGTKDGVLIDSVRPWSPADRAGLKAGDVVIGVDGHAVRTATDLANALNRDLSGVRLSVGVTRDRRTSAIEVKVTVY
jgi:S1-C subfamily serine protease